MSPSAISSLSTLQFPIIRNFKAFDDGKHKKFILTVYARHLPLDLPLEANARLPNVIRNPTCREMRRTLLTRPDKFLLLNSGIICTATTFEVRQDGAEHVATIQFDEDGGIVNGGHSYAQLVQFVHGETAYAQGKDLRTVLAEDGEHDADVKHLVDDDAELEAAIVRAREKAQVQIEVIVPVDDQDLLVEISTARNRSQPVTETGFQNLAGRFDLMKSVLRKAAQPFGPSYADNVVVWKPNQDVDENAKAVGVKSLIQLIALMNIARYPSDTPANEVYTRAGTVVREFGDPSEEEARVYDGLTHLLPQLISLYEHIYVTLPEIQQAFPWADGKEEADRAKRRRSATTPFLDRPCPTKVAPPFIWPIFASLRNLLEWDANGLLAFKLDPVTFFDEMKAQLVTPVTSFHKRVKLVAQVGRDKEVWIRLDGVVTGELNTRQRLAEMK